MLGKLFRPKWQHDDAGVRRAAVEKIQDQELLARIAATDEDADVRETAIARLSDLGALLQLRKQTAVAESVDQRIEQRILSQAKDLHYSPELGEFIIEHGSPELLASLVDTASDERLRQVAIECSQSPDLLLKLCTSAQSAETRLSAAKKLMDETTIRQALKTLGKRDKRVSRQLRENLQQILDRKNKSAEIDQLLCVLDKLGYNENWQHDQARLQKLEQQWRDDLQSVASEQQKKNWETAVGKLKQRLGEQEALTTRIQPVLDAKNSLCELVEGFASQLAEKHFLRKPEAAELTATLDSFAADWASLESLPPNREQTLAERFEHALSRCRDLVRTLGKNAQASEQFERLIEQGNALLQKKTLATRAVEKLRQDWEKHTLPKDKILADSLMQDFNKLQARLDARLKKQADTREKGLRNIQQWLQDMETELAEDKVGRASKLFQKIEKTLNNLPELPRDRQREISEKLTDLRPRLRQLEGWRHWATDRAREELIEEAAALVTAELDINARADAVRDLRNRWKKLGKIDPRSSRSLWKRFDQACTEAYEPVKQHRAEEQARRNQNLEKRKHICEQLEKLATDTDWSSPDWRDIDKRFHKLRNQWRNAGPVNRKDWNAINERFNAAVAALDEHLEDERRISRNRRLRLIEKLDAIKDNEDLSLALREAREAQRNWQPTVTGTRREEQKLWKQFRAILDHIYARDQERRQADSEETRSLLEEKKKICETLEALARLEGDALLDAESEYHKLSQQWDDLPDVRDRHAKKLEQRFRQAQQSFRDRHEEQHRLSNQTQLLKLLDGECDADETSPDPEQLNLLLLEMEIILEIDSPEDQHDARMQLQVERLADAMSSSGTEHGHDELFGLAREVCRLKKAGTELPDLDERIAAIRKAIQGA